MCSLFNLWNIEKQNKESGKINLKANPKSQIVKLKLTEVSGRKQGPDGLL